MTEDAFFTPSPDDFMDEVTQSTPKAEAQNFHRIDTPEHVQSSMVIDDAPEPVLSNNGGKGKAKVVVESPRNATPPLLDTTPSQSPQSSDAENHPPSSKPSAAPRLVATPATVKRTPLGTMTPTMSPSKRNVIAGLQSMHPWTNVDLDSVFAHTPDGKNKPFNADEIFGSTDMAKLGSLTSPEKQMTVVEWIQHNAQLAEARLKTECERMVSTFESQGTRAMMALEGMDCSD